MLFKTKMIRDTYHGWGALDFLPELIKPFKIKRILLVLDPSLKTTGLTQKILTLLNNYDIYLFDKIAGEPTLDLAQELVDFTKKKHAELVVGIGGGSALDLAKLVAVLATHEGDVKDYLNMSQSRELKNRGLPKIMVPTTSGTGSEVTNISVLSLESTKDVLTHDFLLADIAILDPALTMSVPQRVTAATGIDALTHAIESYLSVQSNPLTDNLALSAISLITKSLRIAFFDGNNQEARSNLSYGSYLAGIAFFNAGVAGVHALAYPLGGKFKISHGESNALLLPYVLTYIRVSCMEKLKNIYLAMGFDVKNMSDDEASLSCIDEIERLIADIGIPDTLQHFNILKANIDLLAIEANKQTRLLARSPMPLQEKDIVNIYTAAWNGKL